jgi:hypothetical protein
MAGQSIIDGWLHSNDPSVPPISSIAYLFIAILLSSGFIAFDVGKGREKKNSVTIVEMSEFTSVSSTY